MVVKMDVFIETDDKVWLDTFIKADGPRRWRMIYSGDLNGKLKHISFSEPVLVGAPSADKTKS